MTETDETTENAGEVWVKSDVASDGTYVVTIEAGPDDVRSLDRDAALRYAAAVLATAQRAEFDAAVLALLTNRLGLDLQAAGWFVGSLRNDRPAINPADTAPLVLEPGIAMRPPHPAFIKILIHGKVVGQWEVVDARSHALHVLETLEGADLDAGLFRHLMAMDLDEGRARNVVADVLHWRDYDPDNPPPPLVPDSS